MVVVLADSELYTFTGGEPPSLMELEALYQAQTHGSPDEDEVWHNWILRLGDSQTAVGFVQATVTGDSAAIAWLVGVHWQGAGLAIEAATAMSEWLVSQGVKRLTANIHPDHVASKGVASALGLKSTEEYDSDGEVIWMSQNLG
jgi:RimJ/RimL family protein N-acetyltransferase